MLVFDISFRVSSQHQFQEIEYDIQDTRDFFLAQGSVHVGICKSSHEWIRTNQFFLSNSCRELSISVAKLIYVDRYDPAVKIKPDKALKNTFTTKNFNIWWMTLNRWPLKTVSISQRASFCTFSIASLIGYFSLTAALKTLNALSLIFSGRFDSTSCWKKHKILVRLL